MYSFDDIYKIDRKFILDRISEEDIFKRYCSNFVKIDKPFCSELRKDSNPSCNIYRSVNGLRYKDFGDNTYCDCFNYIMLKYGCSYYESFNIVANDFNLTKNTTFKALSPVLGSEVPKLIESGYKRIKTEIQVVSQPFTIHDYNYWSKYKIKLELLQEYNVVSAKYVIISKLQKKVILEYSNTNPIYVYKFVNNGEISYKVYRPLEAKYKWSFNGTKHDIEGYDQLRLNGDVLILTKALKDVMVYRLLGYDAISLQGEANKLEFEVYNKLKQRFNTIVVNYDNDETGIKCAEKIAKDYNLKCFFIDKRTKCKDLSDYISKYGKLKTRKMLKQKINEVIES